MSSPLAFPPPPEAGGLQLPWPALRYNRLQVEPPTAQAIDVDDVLFFGMYANVAGLVGILKVRWQDPDGGIHTEYLQNKPTAGRTLSLVTMQLAAGYILSAVAVLESGAAVRGNCFAIAGLMRNQGPTPAVLHATETFFADHLCTNQPIAWPGGNIRQSIEGPGFQHLVFGSAPAAGAESVVVVPANALWLVMSARATLTTSAAVANRRVHLRVSNGVSTIFDAAAADVQTAGLTRNYNMIADEFQRTGQDAELYIPGPLSWLLPAAAQLFTATTLIDAGDQWGAMAVWVQEWIVP